MEILLNGKTIQTELQTIEELVASRIGIAVAINGEVVPMKFWKSRQLVESDTVEIIAPFQGG